MSSTKTDLESLLQFTTLNLEHKMEDSKIKLKSFEELRLSLVKQANYYREENAKMEALLKKLKTLRTELNLQCQGELDKLRFSQDKYDTKQCTSEAIGLSHAERLRKQNNYLTKIKSCIKIHNHLIERLLKEIHIAKRSIEKSHTEITNIKINSTEEIKSFQVKIERYEKELLKFEKRYPWLNDPQYNLQNISKETEVLNLLRKEKDQLLEELEVYQGLKPDINDAKQQLAEMKQKYMSMH